MSQSLAEAAHPPIASRAEWLEARLALLEQEKALTRESDRVNAQRRLPMVRVEKAYSFEGAAGTRTLRELFEDQSQLIVYHFMFGPEWETGCPGCTWFIDAMGRLSELGEKDARFVVVSRAPLAKLMAYRAERGWDVEWVSSLGSDFNVEFGVTLDPARGATSYNYRPVEAAAGYADEVKEPQEMPGMSVFFRVEDAVYHTYSTFGRGVEGLTDVARLADVTPWGRQEDFEESPAGWPQRATYG